METLVGVNRGFTAFVTQRQALKSQIPTLRPGALVTVTINNQYYSILFVHLKSSTDPRSWDLCDDMIRHVRNLKRALDGVPGQPATGSHFIVMGDLNTMGMNLTYSNKDVTGPEELGRYGNVLDVRDLSLLSKDAPNTWCGGGTLGPSNLDRIFASENLSFETLNGAKVRVIGWPELNTPAQQRNWINRHSDLAMIYAEVSA